MQDPVITVAHPQPVGERLQMHIGGMGLHRPRDQLVDEPDHRRLARQILEALGILLSRLVIRYHVVKQSGVVAVLICGRIEPVEGGFQFDWDSDCDTHGVT